MFKLLTTLKHKGKSSIWSHLNPGPDPAFAQVLGANLRQENLLKERDTATDPFDGFIGNESAIFLLKESCSYAKKHGLDKFPNIAFYGPRSSGKSELSKRTAQALGLPLISLTEENLKKEKALLNIIKPYVFEQRLNSSIIFIDEVHSLSRSNQDKLLLATEPSSKIFKTQNWTFDCSSAIFVVATTDPAKLTEAFRSRFTTINLESYNEEDIIKILKHRIDRDSRIDMVARNFTNDGIASIARAGRYVPRECIQILSIVSQSLSLQKDEITNWTQAIEQFIYFGLKVDSIGLNEMDQRYLLVLLKLGTAGINVIASHLGDSPSNIETIVEPYLLQIDLIQRMPKGRTLTEKGGAIAKVYQEMKESPNGV